MSSNKPVAARPAKESSDLQAALARVAVGERRISKLEGEVKQRGSIIEAQRREIAALKAQNSKLTKELAKNQAALDLISNQYLEIKKNSNNSSTPPSAEGPKAKAERNYPKRETSGKPAGGQGGHVGSSSKRLEPTETKRYEPEGVCVCGRDIGSGNQTRTRTRQLVGVEVSITATDHVQVSLKCGCGRVHEGQYPEGLFEEGSSNPVMYDDSIKTLAVSLVACAKLPASVTATWFATMLGLSFSSASLRTWVLKLAKSLDNWDVSVIQLLKNAVVVGADETPIRVAGMKGAHAHVVVTKLLTRFHLAGRAMKDIVAGGVLKDHTGVLVSDDLKAYRGLGITQFQTCTAHLLRYLRFAVEVFTPHNPDLPHPYPGLAKLRSLLQEAIHATRQRSDQKLKPPGPKQWESKIRVLCTQILAQLNTAPKSKPITDTINLVTRLQTHLGEGSLLRFTSNYEVPPTNNYSERALRPLKVWQRRSGTRRSVVDTRAGLRVDGYIDTARKNGVNPLLALQDAMAGNPYIPV